MSNFLIGSIVSCMIDWIIIANQVYQRTLCTHYVRRMRFILAVYLYSKEANYYKRRCLSQVSHGNFIMNKTKTEYCESQPGQIGNISDIGLRIN